MKNLHLIAVCMFSILLAGCQRAAVPAVPVRQPPHIDSSQIDLSTPPGEPCTSNADCKCEAFNGARYVPGKYVQGECDAVLHQCAACVVE